ncbi:ABC transporter permease [Candidatus Odyssella acanthamoebae]|uniref:ABC transporter permease n=1 Tax=Candidatus Odyssella acanthamoebae TaxID=91604 RepID=A0A077AU37_9PROT|nr:ABC transporter permease [Candidatus Paracaedibacter acanthamoebae]AIK95514.1 ABC transporter permease [Candidatus Paracaedibacter acanthamoebae]
MALTPLTQRRLAQFKKNRRGFYSLIIFAFIFLVTTCAEFIANDKPLLVYFDGHLYSPVLKNYPETHWGGVFETETNYRDPVVKDLISAKGWYLFPLIPYSFDTVNYDLTVPAPAPPSSDNWLGTDDQGRDLLARLIYGTRISIWFGLILTFFAMVIGITVGGLQGYFGGKIDLYVQRFIEIWSGLPILYLLMILSSMVQPNFWWLLGIMLLFGWMNLVAVVRAEFFRTRSLDYVRAAEALGVSNISIMHRHILPNAMVATITYLPFIINASITTLTSLDFLGFGLPPGSPSLGELITQGKNNVNATWLVMAGFTSLALILSLLVFIGEAIRDAFDARKVVAS